jgi:hypothetical protein
VDRLIAQVILNLPPPSILCRPARCDCRHNPISWLTPSRMPPPNSYVSPKFSAHGLAERKICVHYMFLALRSGSAQFERIHCSCMCPLVDWSLMIYLIGNYFVLSVNQVRRKDRDNLYTVWYIRTCHRPVRKNVWIVWQVRAVMLVLLESPSNKL